VRQEEEQIAMWKRTVRVRGARFVRFALLLFLGFLALPLHAGQERYDYDALGRLVRVIDEQGRVTQYVYDAAGNILQVITGAPGSAQAPSITSISPSSIRQGGTQQVTISGSALAGVSISISDPNLDVGGVQITATQVSFALTAFATAAVGTQTISLQNAAGTATASITVNPQLPKVFVDPTPLAIPPDSVARNITIRLSNADNIDHTLALSISNANATISPASLTIPAGQTQAQASVRGVTAGQATLTMTSPTLGTTVFPVFVTGEFTGVSTSYAVPLGVTVQTAAQSNQQTITPVASNLVGVVSGSFVSGVSPRTLTIGTGPNLLAISGSGLQTAQSLAIVPSTGLTVGALTVAPDGTAVTVPVTVAPDAPILQRQVVLRGASSAFPALPGADRINVVRAPPRIDSIDPIFSTTGSLFTLTVRGANLQDVRSVSLSPSTGITVDAFPVASTDGSILTASVSIAPNAPVGSRTVVVITSGGSSDTTASAANTFNVVNQVVQTVTPIAATAVGVLLQSNTPPPPQSSTLFASGLGVVVGPVITAISPTVGTIGQTTTLTLQGQGLQGVSAVQFVPSTGLTLGSITVAADGTSVSIPVTVDIAAPQTVRTVRVLRGTAQVPFAPIGSALFFVSAPAPALDSMTPIVLQVGQPATTLSISGRNLQNASSVSIVPPDGVSINNPPSVAAGGSSLTVSISAAANAAAGPRAIVVTTPGGSSPSTASPQNTLTLSATAGTNVTPIVSPALGVLVQTNTPPSATPIGPIASAVLGVVVQGGTPPPPATQTLFSTANVGVTLGSVATGIAPAGFSPGSSGTLTIQGFALNGVTSIAVAPSTGITLGALTVAPDGTQVSVPVTVAAGAPTVVHNVVLQAGSAVVPFADTAASRFSIANVPSFDSITPIVVSQGTTFTLTIRGSNFTGATAVTATPPDGIAISNTFTVNSAGTELDVPMSIAPNAPVGPRVIQVLVPGAASSATAAPANTLNIVTP
jgi:YD repeat-containing protein